jgi:predicted nucleotidyltransferase
MRDAPQSEVVTMNWLTNEYICLHRINNKLRGEIDEATWEVKKTLKEILEKEEEQFTIEIYGSLAYGIFERFNSDIDITIDATQGQMTTE